MKRAGLLLLLALAWIAIAQAATSYTSFVLSEVANGKGYPTLEREGAVYGSDGTTHIFFAGGVNTLTPNVTTALTDIYTYVTSSNTFVKSNESLPEPSYYGVGGVQDSKLYIFSGRNRNVSTDSPGNFTYSDTCYVVDFKNKSLSAPVITSFNVDGEGRQFASSFLAQKGVLYVFGGLTGNDGTDAVDHVFIKIDTVAGKSSTLPCDTNCPLDSLVSPVVFMDVNQTKFYVYSGLSKSASTFAANDKLYAFDVKQNKWDAPYNVTNGANIAFAAVAPTLASGDSNNNATSTHPQLIVVGGSNGTSGSQTSLWAFDLTVVPPALKPLKAQLPRPRERAAAGVDGSGTVWIYSGARYANATASKASAYDEGVLRLAAPGKKHHYYTNWSVSVGARAIMIGVAAVIVLAIVVGTLVLMCKSRRGGGIRRPGYEQVGQY